MKISYFRRPKRRFHPLFYSQCCIRSENCPENSSNVRLDQYICWWGIRQCLKIKNHFTWKEYFEDIWRARKKLILDKIVNLRINKFFLKLWTFASAIVGIQLPPTGFTSCTIFRARPFARWFASRMTILANRMRFVLNYGEMSTSAMPTQISLIPDWTFAFASAGPSSFTVTMPVAWARPLRVAWALFTLGAESEFWKSYLNFKG